MQLVVEPTDDRPRVGPTPDFRPRYRLAPRWRAKRFWLLVERQGNSGGHHQALTARCGYRLSEASINATYRYQKTKQSRRTIELSPRLIAELERWRKESPPTDKDSFVFPSPVLKDKPLDPDSFYTKTWTKAFKLAGVRLVGYHALRHTHASILLNHGVPIKVVSERLGHADVKMTVATYGHMFRTTSASVMEKLDAAVPAPLQLAG